jgi:hypothetical protein
MPNATVRANAPASPNVDHLPPREALRKALLAERAELIAEPLTETRQREIAACDLLLERLAKLEVVQ